MKIMPSAIGQPMIAWNIPQISDLSLMGYNDSEPIVNIHTYS